MSPVPHQAHLSLEYEYLEDIKLGSEHSLRPSTVVLVERKYMLRPRRRRLKRWQHQHCLALGIEFFINFANLETSIVISFSL